MKNIKWSSLFIGLICLCSCVDLTELNENPTKATSISPHLLIPTIQLTHSQYMQNTIATLSTRVHSSTTGLAAGVCRSTAEKPKRTLPIWNASG